MSTQLQTTDNRELATVSASAKKYITRSKSESTLRVYKVAMRDFAAFAQKHNEVAMPYSPAVIVEYITSLADAGAKVNTITTYLAGVAWAHRTAGHADPTSYEIVKATMVGIRRTLRVAPNKKEPATMDEIRAMIAALPDTLKGTRDRAIILVGFAGAYRRSELVGMDVEHIRFNGETRILVPSSKTDQAGEGRYKHLPVLEDNPLDPTAALRDWLDGAGIASGPVFRRIDRHGNVHPERLTSQTVARVVKSAARAAGLDWRAFSGHSLRSGFVTEAKKRDVPDGDVMAQTWHTDARTLRGYDHATGAGAIRAVKVVMGNES